MNGRRSKLTQLPRWAGLAALLVILAPSTVFATHFELSRLANQIELISDQLADDLRYTRHYGTVRSRAVTLRREAGQLADSLRRNSSNSRIRSRFKDVRRSYERLEQAFFVADRRDHDPRVFREINLLSNVFTNLSDEYYYAGFDAQRYGPIYDVPYSGISIIGSRNYNSRGYGSRNYGSRNPGSRNYGSRNNGARNRDLGNNGSRNAGSRSGGRITPSRERAVPEVFRGNNGRAANRRQNGRAGLDRGSRSVQSAPPNAQRSNVLERQGRQNAARRELENQARGNRAARSSRESAGRRNVQRGRSAVPESRRRNHYE